MSDGNLIGFKVFFNSKGVMMSELSQLPIKDIDRIFKTTEEKQIVKTVIEEAYRTLVGLHEDLEKELNALNTRIV